MLIFILYLLFPALIVYKAQINVYSFYEDVLSKNDTAVLRGIAAIGVMLSHYIHSLSIMGVPLGIERLFEHVGGLSVCVFFFLSGYGVYASFCKSKGENRNRFLWRRLSTVYFPYLFLRILFFVLVKPDGIDTPLQSLAYVLGVIEPFWFVTVILLMYFMVYLLWEWKERMIPVMAIFALLAAPVIVIWFPELPDRWYNANLLFVFGMFFYEKREQCIVFFQKNYILKFIFAFIAFVISGIGFALFKAYAIAGVLKVLSGCLLSIWCVMLLLKIRLYSPVMKYIGIMSLHLYLVHIYIWDIMLHWHTFENPVVLFITTVIISILVTIVLFYIEKGIKNVVSLRSKGNKISE